MGIQDDKTRASAVVGQEIGNGFGYAFRYQDPRSRMYAVTGDRFEAENIAGDDYEMVLVHFTDGCIDRIVGSDSHEEKKPEADGDGGSHRRQHSRVRQSDRPENGFGLACRYIDPDSGAYGWTSDPKDARRIAGDDYETVWVRYRRGKIDHAVTVEEYKEELEVRIGERISEGLSDAQLNEFDLIDDQAEATRWLERNRPDFRDIVNRTIREMERGIVLEASKDVSPES